MKTAKFDRFIRENPWVGMHFNAIGEELNAWIKKLDYIAFRPFSSLFMDAKSIIGTKNFSFSSHFSLTPNFMPWQITRYGIWFHNEGENFATRWKSPQNAQVP